MGSNFAECHPVGFRFVMRARERGARIIHVDPRFTRTSAMSSLHVPIRAGSDIAFLGGLINHVLHSERWRSDPFFREYLVHYTNAAVLVDEDFRDVAELGGVFSGWDEGERRYDPRSWEYEGTRRVVRWGVGRDTEEVEQTRIGDLTTAQARGLRTGRVVSGPPPVDATLEHPRCVFQVLKRHFAAYTPERVERACGVPAEVLAEVAETLLENSGRERTTAIAYAVGWTQHTTGPQIIASAAILQLLLGNIGRPGGGIQALRGHATIQGSTDIPTLYDLLPGYLHMPTAAGTHETLDDYIWNEAVPGTLWDGTRAYLVSLLKAWFGDAATAGNEFGYGFLPRVTGDHSHLPMFVKMHAGEVEGLVLLGQNPAVGGQNARFQREALGRLKWLVVRDIFLTESATFWSDSPEAVAGEVRPEEVGTEIFVLPAATVAEKDGSFTNTQRLIQWHSRAVPAPGACRSDAWFIYHLGRRLKALYVDSTDEKDRPIQALTWDYATEAPHDEPVMEYVLREINGFHWAPTWEERRQLEDLHELRDDGSTACGCWIYAGVFPGYNHAALREKGDGYVAPRWGFSWPGNVRMLYNRCSADPRGRPWSERKKYVWWDEGERRWVGKDRPDFPEDKPPDQPADPTKSGTDALPGDGPFILRPHGKAQLYFPFGLKDGPLPTHYEPWETPVRNPIYAWRERNPLARHWDVPGNRYHDVADPRFPYVLTTYRLTEHHTAGGMTRWNSWLGELQPAAFVELSPELAAEKGIRPGDWVTVITERGEVEARALVTRRMRPLVLDGRTIHQVGFPYHFGYEGLVRGGTANDLVALVADPNVTIHEGKVLTCDIRRGRAWGGGESGEAP